MVARVIPRLILALMCAMAPLALFVSSCGAPEPTYRVAVIAFKGSQLEEQRNSLVEYGQRRIQAELGAEVELIAPASGYEPGDLFSSPENGYDLIVSMGQASGQDMLLARPGDTQALAAALDFESAQPVPGEGAVSLVRYRVEEGAYVCGFLAGWLTTRKDHPLANPLPNVAFIGAMDDPLQPYYDRGYSQGVRAAVAKPGIYRYFLSTAEDSINARACATEAVKKGSDVIFCTPGNFNGEVLKVAEEKNVLVILVGADRSGESPDHVLTSLILRDDNALFDAVSEAMQGDLETGRQVWGIEEGLWSLAPFHGHDAYIRMELKEALQQEEERVGQIDFSP